MLSDSFAHNIYRNAKETPDNGSDDDGNGLIDDYHGFNFVRNAPGLTTRNVAGNSFSGPLLHGSMCAATAAPNSFA